MKPQKQISVINIALTLVVVLFVISIFSLFSCETLLEPITTLTEGRNCSTVIKQTAPDAATQPDNTNEGDIQVCSLGSWFDYQEYKDAALNGSPLYLLSNPTIGFYTYKRDYDYRSESLIIKLIDSFIPVEIFFPGISGDINGEVPISSYEGNMSWGVSLLKSEDIKYPQIN
ncbi:hypothetical protein SDC9_179445 [bioreactor metagenome]|uniref:Uncharacterized protein n=1 Tax=bioreactor metagenome TaxID=1076179 RepID=A0A645GZX9_9ZZZZ